MRVLISAKCRGDRQGMPVTSRTIRAMSNEPAWGFFRKESEGGSGLHLGGKLISQRVADRETVLWSRDVFWPQRRRNKSIRIHPRFLSAPSSPSACLIKTTKIFSKSYFQLYRAGYFDLNIHFELRNVHSLRHARLL